VPTWLQILGVCILVSGITSAADEAANAPEISPGVCQRPAVTDLKIVNHRWPDASSARSFAEDVVRISGAKTDQDKALALWQWIRRCTMRITAPPNEPLRRSYIDDPVKILNVYGAHHCDGLSRVMQNCWRALGYPAQKYYRNGHTYADCWWVDADGVGRYHTFDMNYGWFLFTRDGSRIATGEEIGTDFSLSDIPSRTTVPWIDKKYWMWAWIHAAHRRFSRHDMRLQLHPGDEVERLWGNLGRPYQEVPQERIWDDPDPRPYPWTYGNGIHRLAADLGPNWRGQLAAEPVNAAVPGGRLVQADPGKPAEVIYRVRVPYVIADADIEVAREGGRLELAFSQDGGGTWRVIATVEAPGPTTRTITLSKVGLDKRTGPIGRYDYLLRVRLDRNAALSALRVDTILQHNFLALPTLLPGDNAITISGRLAKGHAIEVTCVWDDPTGEGLTHTIKAESLPFAYTIRAAGRKWEDVRCRRLTVRVVRNDGAGNRVVTAPPAPPASAIAPIKWADVLTLNGPKPPPKLKTTAEYLRDLASTDPEVRRLAAAGLIVRRDPQAWDALERTAYQDVTTLKFYAVQALYWTDSRRAWPVMARMLERDPKVKWPDVPMTKPQRGMWLSPEDPVYDNVVALIAVLCARAKITEATPLLCAALRKVKYPEPRWAILRSLGRLGDQRAVETVRRYVRTRGSDTAATAIEAAGRLGDTEVIPRLKQILARRRGYSIQRIKAIEALARLGAQDATDILLPYLRNEDEDCRGTAAEALGRIGDRATSIPALEAAVKVETHTWARAKMRTALQQLRSRAGP